MEANKILHSDILDIIFDGKNKSYGAYDLRKTYNHRLKKALIATGSLLLLIFWGIVLAGTSGKRERTIDVSEEIHLGDIKKELPVIPVEPKPPVTKVKQVAFPTLLVVDDNLVNPNQRIEDIPDDAAIGTQTIITDNTDRIVKAPVVDTGSTITALPVKSKEPDVWLDVQIPAEFPGGITAWQRYLEKNLDPETAINNGAGEGTYTVVISFIVSKDGTISNVIPATKIGYGLEEEAIKIIKKGPKWVPARQNGQQVNAYRSQPITFLVTGN